MNTRNYAYITYCDLIRCAQQSFGNTFLWFLIMYVQFKTKCNCYLLRTWILRIHIFLDVLVVGRIVPAASEHRAFTLCTAWPFEDEGSIILKNVRNLSPMTPRHIPEDLNPQIHYCENPKSHVHKSCLCPMKVNFITSKPARWLWERVVQAAGSLTGFKQA